MLIAAESLDSALVGTPLSSGVDPQYDYVISPHAMSQRSGCQAKLAGSSLSDILLATSAAVPDVCSVDPDDPRDCAVLGELTAGTPLLVSTDFNPLVGPNLRVAGVIAALHAASDIHASGGIPRWALVNAILIPDLIEDGAVAMMAGIWDACRQEQIELIGGQTILGAEAMVGLTVLGLPYTDAVVEKTGARPGDALLLSKPVGTGLMVRAFKLQLIDEQTLDLAIRVMCTSNRQASTAMMDIGVIAATDVTGFGLLGHLAEMLPGNLGATLDYESIPILEPAIHLPRAIGNTIWIRGNKDYVADRKQVETSCSPEEMAPLLDPQTNGGLLLVAAPDVVPAYIERGFARIGTVTQGGAIELRR